MEAFHGNIIHTKNKPIFIIRIKTSFLFLLIYHAYPTQTPQNTD